MGLRDMYSAGDIIEYEGGGRDYLVSIEGDECHPFFADLLYEGAEVVGHFGEGTVEDARRWYGENKAVYRG